MNASAAAVRRTSPSIVSHIAKDDPLHFYRDGHPDYKRVADFVKLNKVDLGRIAGVAKSSVRFDAHIPEPVAERLREIANIANLVAQFFEGDAQKVGLWFEIANPLLGNVSPRDMIRIGRYKPLLSFVLEAREANASPETTTLHAQDEAAQAVGRRESNGANAVNTAPVLPARIAELQTPIEVLCVRHGVRELALFGSVLRDDFDPTSSDIDVVVKFGPPKCESLARQYFGFKEDLEALFARPVDLVELEVMPDTRLKRIIERSKRTVYAAAA